MSGLENVVDCLLVAATFKSERERFVRRRSLFDPRPT
jgi:hypothetical protein